MSYAADIETWTVDEVAGWLRQENFGQFQQKFIFKRITGKKLLDLQENTFYSLMGRDDRSSQLWRNITTMRSRRSNRNQGRKPPPRNFGPQVPQRDYPPPPDDFFAEGVDDDDQEVYEMVPDEMPGIEHGGAETDDDLDDDFTDDEQPQSDEDYLEPEEGPPPQVPTRPTQSGNASWASPAPASNKLTDLQIGLMRKMSERAVRNIPNQSQGPGNDDGDELYLAPTEEQEEFYDVPHEGAEQDDDIYDVPEDDVPPSNTPRQPPPSQQQNRFGNQPGPRMPQTSRPPPPNKFPPMANRGPPVPRPNDPVAPPIPSRVQMQLQRPASPDDEEYTLPGEAEDEELYLEPQEGGNQQPPMRHVQSRELPRPPPQAGGPRLPNRPPKIPTEDVPNIPSRPPQGRREPPPNPKNRSMPDIPNGDRPPMNIPTAHPRIPTIPSQNNNDAENGNVSAAVKSMMGKFEVDNNNDNNGRRPTGLKPWNRNPAAPPPIPPGHTPAIPRSVPLVGNMGPRRPGIPPSTSSTTSTISTGSDSSTGSDIAPPAPTTTRPRLRAPTQDPPDMPPFPQPNMRRPSPPMPQLPQPNQSGVMKILNEQSQRPPQIPQPAPPKPPASPSRTIQPQSSSSKSDLVGYPWFHGNLGRPESEKILNMCRKDGAFVVRNSTKGDASNPYSLSLWYNGRVRNLQIRKRLDQKYALGSRKENEMAFDTPVSLVEYHKMNSLILAQEGGKTILTIAAPRF